MLKKYLVLKIFILAFVICLSVACSEYLGSDKSCLQNEQKESKACSERLGSEKNGLESIKSSGSNPFKNANIGDYVKFGRYPQTAEGEVRPVEWQVLAIENNKVLVISRYGLDAKRFDPESNDWSESEIRRWLNGEFYNSTFSGEEKARIKSFNQDNVFLLSYGEAEKYFANSDARKCRPTAYAKAKGAFGIDDFCCWCCWWLCSPNPIRSNGVLCVNFDGDINYECVDIALVSVRPALWINLDGSEKNGISFSESRKSSGSNPFKNANIGDYVKFGRYPQTAEGEVRPVEWQVLARENNKALVISRYALDARRFDSESNDWSESEIRRWLNGEFYNSTFSGEEKARIKSFNQDYVFLLSEEESEKYFANSDARKCKPTAYAKAKGADVYEDCWFWWLRSPNPDSSNYVYYVNCGGDVRSNGVGHDDVSARPALWINL